MAAGFANPGHRWSGFSELFGQEAGISSGSIPVERLLLPPKSTARMVRYSGTMVV